MSAASVFYDMKNRLWRAEDRMSLRTQVAMGTGLLCFAIVAVVALGAARVGQQQAEAAASAETANLAYTLADRLDRGIASRLSTLKLFGELDALRRGWVGDSAILRKVLDKAKTVITGAAWIGFATPDGIVKAASGAMLEGQSVAERPWFKAGLKGTTFQDVHEAKLLAPLLGPAPDGKPYRFVDIAIPIHNTLGDTLGVLGLHIAWNWVDDLRKTTLDRTVRGDGTDLWIIDRSGKVLLGPTVGAVPFTPTALAEIAQSKRGAFLDRADGTSTVTGYASAAGYGDYPGLGWTVVARQPAAIAYGEAREVVWAIIALGLVVGTIGIACATVIAGRIARPIRRLTEKADRIGRDPNQTLPRVRGSLEVVRLSSALRGLLLRLGFAEQRTVEVEHRAADEAKKFSHDIEILRTLADTDALTKLHNRRSFMVFGEDAMEHYRRYRRSFAILMADIDRFKQVNDTLGHAAGDTVIGYVAGTLAETVRPTDKTARFGGEEFVVLLHEITPESAMETAERIRKAVADAEIMFNGHPIRASISIGVSIVGASDHDLQDVIERADLSLYTAKAEGRNRVSAQPMREQGRRRA